MNTNTFAIFRSVLLRIRNVSDQSFRENQNTHSMFSKVLFENHVVYEKMRNSFVKLNKPQMKIGRRHIACWIPRDTNTPRI